MAVGVLHCYSDYKWTGPSEPVAMLCQGLLRRGWRSELACTHAPAGQKRSLAARAREMGIMVHDGFYFEGLRGLRSNLGDVTRLRRLIREGDFRLVHVHGSWDHVLAAIALRRTRRLVPLIRSEHRGREFSGRPWERFQCGPAMTDHLIVLSDRLRARAVDRLKLDPRRVTTVRGAVDAERYRPREAPPGIRRRFGLAEHDVIFGIASRVQWHRRFEVLLEGFDMARRRDGRIKLVVLGRGTDREAILDRPVARMGLERTVLPLGYRDDDYLEVLSMLDAGVMLVPGSDGSCRAAMQLAAMGKPLVVAARGVLPDIVQDGRTGIVVKDTPQELARAIIEMAHDAPTRIRQGELARKRMLTHFSPRQQATRVEEVYRRLLCENAPSDR